MSDTYVEAPYLSATDATATSTFTNLSVSGRTELSGMLTLTALSGGILTTDANGFVSTTSIGAASVTSNSLDPVSFVYNQVEDRIRYGFIAEDVADVDEILATYDAEGNISGIDDRAMVATVLKAVQEMWSSIQEYFARTEELEKEVATLKMRIEALESGNPRSYPVESSASMEELSNEEEIQTGDTEDGDREEEKEGGMKEENNEAGVEESDDDNREIVKDESSEAEAGVEESETENAEEVSVLESEPDTPLEANIDE